MDTKNNLQQEEAFYEKFAVPPAPIKKEEIDYSYTEELKAETRKIKDLLNFKMTNQFQVLQMITHTNNHHNNRIKANEFLDYNRYTDILPYKHSVVKISGSTQVDQYINANYINNPFKDKAYIATQGPIPNTISSFWRMIWEQKTNLIIMLCKEFEQNKVKCDKYWPSQGQILQEGDLQVQFLSQQKNAQQNIIERQFILKYKNEQRQVSQVHWEGWPDHGVPESRDYGVLENLVQRVVNQIEQSKIPVVHCSAGVGRTGTLLALSNIYMTLKYHQVKKTPIDQIELNVLDIVRRLREQRMIMVQMDNQLNLVYEITKTFIRKMFKF
ncbi:tyrosine phosphatase (macronuclear) [Tetrahymena thermophila SB210]|uniref:Tyrosine phosphatase n=1 Tax=Tetrahymena thermophila (strain SB210) TaxID=312017 RepID=I7M9H7_TETTS|nr:tyrosine phosphatase [Tetrahymena thermophila SB210]EAS01773.2 tyrosine phosphatase [Tetrahymena thermophila SB210]|eukprot:XP_001022018.2 tyrosine phosphatase [Tetrahymena thermophila SB210]